MEVQRQLKCLLPNEEPFEVAHVAVLPQLGHQIQTVALLGYLATWLLGYFASQLLGY